MGKLIESRPHIRITWLFNVWVNLLNHTPTYESHGCLTHG